MEELRELLSRALSWADAHVSAEEVLTDYPAELQGRIIPGQNYSPYQLLEHLRIAQKDILDFSRSSSFRHLNWPADYWPEKPEPPDSEAWDRSMKEFRFDREEMTILIQDESKDLFEPFAHGTGQTLARQAILLIDHNAYHLGQMALFRKMQGDESRKLK
ncbi:MAG TPA: ABC transporter [Leptospiraceae bacterium]|nr:ABC transporter [Spirochaetaceae bacterium]HBS05961.1 ABC transporter [Leptospiraceae bacterium]|tara:strand:+ start:5006 stop:5485 length:480 start_codon:yes stop_codon:yes gene_type:complete